jgi:crotonobetainyl-CoA:carnitine CoA-transferase CaiB-like acyl-CoA transferase
MSDAGPGSGPGPLTGLRVIELASEPAALAGKLLADYGAEVLLVEPIGGHPSRGLAPLAREAVDDDPNRSLWFLHYNTSKLGLALDLDTDAGATQFRALVSHADVVLEAEPVGRLGRLGLDHADLAAGNPQLVWVSVTPFGREDPRSGQPFTDLTLVAGGGMAWNCGYDDHSLPPMRARGDQAYQTASIWAAVSTLVGLRARSRHGQGQLVDVSMYAAANVTTEQASYWWMAGERIVQRQTGRHAAVAPTELTIRRDRDGHEVHTGVLPRHADELARLITWVDDLGLRDQVPTIALLDMAVEAGGIDLAKLDTDPMTQEWARTARDAITLIASRTTHTDFFVDGQTRGFSVGMILTPDEVMTDRHMVARGFAVEVDTPQLGRSVIYPGLPVMFTATPGEIRPAPSPGQHQHLLAANRTRIAYVPGVRE